MQDLPGAQDLSVLENRLLFERTVSRISSRFVAVSADLVDVIQRSLEDLAKTSHASRAYIFSFRDEMQFMDNTHEWCAEGVSPEISNLQNLSTDIFPWWMEKLLNNEIILIPDVNQMPAEAAAEHEILSMQHVLSLLVMPLHSHGKLHGYIGFDNIQHSGEWREEDVVLLRLSAEIFGNAFHRLEDERLLRKTNQDLAERLEEIHLLQSRLIQQEQMVGIGQLAAGISHELNNPLAFIGSNLETLRVYSERIVRVLHALRKNLTQHENKRSPSFHKEIQLLWQEGHLDRVLPDYIELLNDTEEGLSRITHIVSSLRNLARVDHPEEFRYEDLNALLDELVLILQNELGDPSCIIRNFGCIDPVRCHRGQLSLALINVLRNASQALQEMPHEERGPLTIDTCKIPDGVKIRISDTGPGIPVETLPHVFKPFYTTRDVGKGSGLGLSMAYDIVVNQHQGDISLESNPGHGTTVVITLPVDNPITSAPASAPPQDMAPSS